MFVCRRTKEEAEYSEELVPHDAVLQNDEGEKKSLCIFQTKLLSGHLEYIII